MICDRDCSPRIQAKTLRILRTVDILAAYRLPKSLREINERVCELTGSSWCERTTWRDLEVLKAIGLVDESVQGYRMNLRRSERLQSAACVLFDAA
jgi:hypothetical protein